ncbi:MAG: FAD-dependent oxidoreductase, partial [Thermodesulfobacteriota bacterium]
GRRVRLFEKAGELGGRATTQAKDGFSFNLGPHALYRTSAAMRVLDLLGIRPEGSTPLGSGAWAVRGGTRHGLPGGFFSLLTTSLLGVAGKMEVARLLARIQSIDVEPLQSVTVEEGVARLARREEVRELLAALFRLTSYGNAPRLQSAGASLEQLQRALGGNVLYLHGGWQQLVDALRGVAVADGVEITSAARVEAVESAHAAGTPHVVRVSGGRSVACAAVILAVPPADAAALLTGAARATVSRWAEQAVPVEAACLDLALSRLPEPRSTFALGIDEPLYLSVHSAVARLAPEGGALVHVAKYLDPDQPADPTRDQRQLEQLMELVQPGWRAHVVHRRFLPHVVVANAVVTAAHGGLAGRPGPEVPGVPGLYVAGDWVGQEGMLADASLGSARRAAEHCVRAVPAVAVAA